MDILLQWAKPVAAGFMGELPEGGCFAAVTFDDGLVSVLENALPELEKRNIPATLFIPTGYLGQKCTWMRVGKMVPSERDRKQLLHDSVMSADQLRKIKNDLVTLGAHGVRHIHLTSLTQEEDWKELRDSKFELEQIIGQEIDLFSFPRGMYTPGTVQRAREAGYRRVFTIEPKPGLCEPGEFVTGRVTVEPNDCQLEFLLKLIGSYRWMPWVSTFKRNLAGLVKHSG